MLTSAKHAVKKMFESVGLEIRKKRPPEVPEVPRASMRGALRQISRLGFKPATVIDVGVATDTAELYQEFKDSRILLIEPLVEFEPCLRRICATYDAQYVLAAAGDTPGTVNLNVHEDRISSSIFKEVEGTTVDGVPRTVRMVTIDEVCSEKGLPGPYLIKLDVQGAELQVLAGAGRSLLETEIVILEVTLTGTMIGGPQFSDVIAKMKEMGFVTYDVWGFFYRPLDNALCQVDVAFVQEQGLFRRTAAFATREQREAHTRGWVLEWERQKLV